jgi:NADH-quinone oxidoreductase subunit J
MALAAHSDMSLNGTVLAPVVLGFLAIWYLLPTPRRRSVAYGTLGVVAAVLGFGLFLWHGFGNQLTFEVEEFLFISFSLEAITFGILMIIQRNPARSALFFAVVVLSVCGLFLLLAAPFLMAATIIIYAGAIIVTFLFVIMLSQATGFSDANDRSREPSLAAAVGFVLLGTLLVVLQRVYTYDDVDELIRLSAQYADSPTVDDSLKDPARANAFLDKVVRARERFGYGKIDIPPSVDGVEMRKADSDPVEDMRAELGLTPTLPPMTAQEETIEPDPGEVRKWAAQIHYELAYLKAVRDGRISPASESVKFSPHAQVKPVNGTSDPAAALPKRLPNANVAALGRALFTDHLLAIELGGTLLLVATIGAIAIAGSRPEKAT